jgi:hypothetical protein
VVASRGWPNTVRSVTPMPVDASTSAAPTAPHWTPRSTKAIGSPLGWSKGGYEWLFRIMDIIIYLVERQARPARSSYEDQVRFETLYSIDNDPDAVAGGQSTSGKGGFFSSPPRRLWNADNMASVKLVNPAPSGVMQLRGRSCHASLAWRRYW